ncbi:MAG TPA: ABC transporter permease [Spirochaetota bacterium]|nr:ABC transporter permease [Spirochaetota bacterium]
MKPSPYSKKRNELLSSFPSFIWLVILFVIPIGVIFAIAFKAADPYGGIGEEWTLSTIKELFNPIYPAIFWRTIYLSLISTFIAILLALPVGYYIARTGKRMREIFLVLVIVPFWTNFLIRIIAWKVLLHPDGFIKKILVTLSLADPNSILLYRPETVLIVLVYSHLPFAILPIYAAAEKFDFSLIEAARDLGASRFQAFRKVFLPGISSGIVAAFIVVLIPSLGSYVIPELVGGASVEMIGSKIAQRSFVDRNLPHASALSALLMLAVFIPLLFAALWQRKAALTGKFK